MNNEEGISEDDGPIITEGPPIAPVIPQQPDPDPITLRSEHAKGMEYIDTLVQESSEEYSSPGAASRAMTRSTETLGKSGIKLDNVPDFMKPLYVRAYNLFKNPHQRLAGRKENLAELVEEAHVVEEEISGILYGSEYSRDRTKMDGLQGKFIETMATRRKCAKAVKELEKEICSTYEKRKTVETALKQKGQEPDTKEIKRLHSDIVTYTQSITSYKGLKQKFLTRIDALDQKVENYQKGIEVATAVYNFVQQHRMNVEAYMEGTDINIKELEALTKIGDIVPKFQVKIKELDGMVKDFYKAMGDRMTAAVRMTETKLDVPKGYTLPGFVNGMRTNTEVQNDERERRVDQILNEPYAEMYKV